MKKSVSRVPINVILSSVAMALFNLLLLTLTYLALSPFAAFASPISSPPHNISLFVLFAISIAATLMFAKLVCRNMQLRSHNPTTGEGQTVKPQTPVESAAIGALANGQKSILVVEDDRDLREHIAEHFVEQYQVYTASDGEAALAIIEQHTPSLIISDVSMPKMDGLSLCKNIKQNQALTHIPIVLLSGQSEQQERLKGLQCGATDYLTKPFYSQELQLKINNLLETCDKQKQWGYSQTQEQQALQEIADDFMQRTFAAIAKNHGDSQFGVDELAYELSMSRRHLLRKVKQQTGQSPVKVIAGYRLEQAAKKLVESPMSISQVAYAVGFESPAHFSRTFKSQFGVAPSQYRAEHQ